MKNIILTALGLILVFGGICLFVEHARSEKSNIRVQSSGGQEYKVVNVEGCQYLVCPSYYNYTVLSHKGNCTNSIHAHNQ
jgi:hypothetical protein